MRPLSAFDAISPAIARTRRVLTLRRSWATALKLAFLASLAEVGSGLNFNFNTHGNTGGQHMSPAALAFFAAFFAAIIALFILIGLALFYIGSRLQFVIFDLLLRQDTQVAPSWRLFGPVTWRWIGIRLLVLLAIGILFSPLLIPATIAFIHVASSPAAGAHPGAFFSLMVGYMGTILLVGIVLFIVSAVVRSFGLPAVVLENASVADTFRRTLDIFRADPGQSLLYLLMQIVLRFLSIIGGYIAVCLVALVTMIPPGILGVIFYILTRNHGSAGKVFLILGCILLGIIWLACVFVASFYIFGSVQLFFAAYAIYFTAGRYQPLGNIVFAQEPQLAYPTGSPYPPPPPVMPPPMAPPPPNFPPAA